MWNVKEENLRWRGRKVLLVLEQRQRPKSRRLVFFVERWISSTNIELFILREKKRERETWISFSCVLSSTRPIAYVYHSKTRGDDLRFRGGFFRFDRIGRCALMNVSNWWTINKRDSFADVYRDIINFSGRHEKFLTKFSVKRID